MSFQFLVKIGITGYYLLNRQYIAEVLCINKKEPEKKCNGRCYLAKQINKTEEQEKSPSQTARISYETIEFISSEVLSCSEQANQGFLSRILFKPYQNSYSFNNWIAFFHPPSTASFL